MTDSPLHVAAGGADLWVAYDQIHSLRLVCDGLGQVVSLPVFRPYGEPEDQELDGAPHRLGFAAMWRTPAMPFLHADRRTYRPDVGRYFQADPAGFADGTNRYAYARNNPAYLVDPSGLTSRVVEDDLRTVGAAIEETWNRTILPGARNMLDAVGKTLESAWNWGLAPDVRTATNAFAYTALGALVAGPVGAVSGAITGAALGAIHGWSMATAGSYNWQSLEGWVQFLADNTWSLPNSAITPHFATAFVGWNRLDQTLSRGTGALILEKRWLSGLEGVTWAGNVITLSESRARKHELIHVLQTRIFGPAFITQAVSSFAVSALLPFYWIPYHDFKRKSFEKWQDYFTKGVYPHWGMEEWACAPADDLKPDPRPPLPELDPNDWRYKF